MNLNDDDKLLNADLGGFYSTDHIVKGYELNDNESAVNTNLKRKLSADNFTSDTFESTITESKSSGQFSMFSGLNVQLVDKNDKKFIKLNLNNCSNDKLKATTTAQASNYQYNKINMTTELDDLPSESDLSSGMTLFLPAPTPATIKNQQVSQSLKTVAPAVAVEKVQVTNQHKQQQHKTVAIYYKCNQCSHVFDSESSFKSHQNSFTCMQSMSNNMKIQGEDSDTNQQQQQQQQHAQTSFKVTKQRSFICNECGKLFQTQEGVSKHMRQEHNDKPTESSSWSTKLFRCYICSLDFALATSLRSHLHKVHAKRLDHEFDDINGQKSAFSTHEKSKQGLEANVSASSNGLDANNNTVLYIKDPKNKSAEIQHMVVYVDGKPIFVQKPKTPNNQTNSVPNEQSNDVLKIKTFQKRTPKLASESDKTLMGSRPKASLSKSAQNSAPVAKIPYLLARAAAAAASSHRQQQASNMQKYQHQQSSSSSSRVICLGGNGSTTAKPNLSGNSKRAPAVGAGSNIELKHDQEYLQLVSMLRQKNEKLLFNPQILNRN